MHGIKILGLSLLAALGLLTVTAAAAQAGEFRVEKSTFASKGIMSETFQGTAGKTQFSVSWLGFEISCSGAELSGTISQGGSTSAKAKFNECQVVGNKFCKIYPTSSDRTAKTNAGQIPIQGNGELLLHAGSHYVKFPSQQFTVLFMTIGGGCTLPAEMIAAGSAAVKFSSALSELVEQPFAAATGAESALLKVSVTCGGEPAEILGSSGTVKLSGANTGKTWGLE